jgi:hypothetical protein
MTKKSSGSLGWLQAVLSTWLFLPNFPCSGPKPPRPHHHICSFWTLARIHSPCSWALFPPILATKATQQNSPNIIVENTIHSAWRQCRSGQQKEHCGDTVYRAPEYRWEEKCKCKAKLQGQGHRTGHWQYVCCNGSPQNYTIDHAYYIKKTREGWKGYDIVD